MIDYYSILGVSESSTKDEIRKAYRIKVMECHPDRGGTHESMVAVNEAWEILSDDIARATYDQARSSHGTNRKATEQFDKDQKAASSRAQEYPRKWAEMDALLDKIAGDFVDAEYGKSDSRPFDVEFPSIRKSTSGQIFIAAGVFLGVLVVTSVVVIAAAIAYYALSQAGGAGRVPGFVAIIFAKAAKPIAIGMIAAIAAIAWGSQYIHRAVGSVIHYMLAGREPVGDPANSGKNKSSSEKRVIPCYHCGQKLRVPINVGHIVVKCGRCGKQFDYPNGPEC